MNKEKRLLSCFHVTNLLAVSLFFIVNSCVYADTLSQDSAATQQSTSQTQSTKDSVSQTANTNSSQPNSTPSNTTPSNTTPSNTTPPFKLSASKVELGLDQLKDVGLDLKHILSICGHLYDEVMIRPVDVITEPEMIGTGVVINLPVAVEPTGPPKPPRKDRVDLLMSELRPIITLLTKNGDEFLKDSQVAGFPDAMQEKLDPLIKKWVAYADDVYARLLKLEALTPGPNYDNYAIADNIKGIQQDIKQIDEVRRPIYKLVQEEGKRLMADQKSGN